MSEIEHVEASLRTDQGRVRGRNEDFVARWEPSDGREAARHGWLYIVADGVGGAEAGDVASRYSTERTIHHYLNGSEERDPGKRLVEAIRAANSDLRQLVAGQAEGTRMATTMVAAVVHEEQLYLANVGDSRGYYWRDGRLKQLTRDQSLVAQLVEEGAITAEEAAHHPHRNVILYSLGSERSPRIDLVTMPLADGDRLLLCSDGLTRYVSDEELTAALDGEDLDAVTAELVAMANDRGGGDNISIALLEMAPDVTAATIPTAAVTADQTAVGAARSNDNGRAARLLWLYTAFLCAVEMVFIFLIWLQLRV